MATPDFEASSAPKFSAVVRVLRNLLRPKYRAHMSGGGAKLPPISDVLRRAGREPRAPE
jgi:hypothetical protein